VGRVSVAFVDRARAVRTVTTAARVEGRTPVAPVSGPWFAARLVMERAREVEAPGRPRVVRTGRVLCAARDEHGDELDVRASDELEVRAGRLGVQRWRITADPELMRVRRRVVGLVVHVERLAEPVREVVA
jgi:hypothetical protein